MKNREIDPGCKLCHGRGYFEYKTGVTDPSGLHEEIAKEPCDCTLLQLELRDLA